MGLLLNPSDWIVRWSHLLAPQSSVLDVACGAGRHLQWFAAQGHKVTGVDRDIDAARAAAPHAHLVRADIENAPWPLLHQGAPRQFDAVIVTNYLWRALMPTLLNSLAPGGVLLYETFTSGQETIGRPSRPEFLLESGELLRYCTDLRVVAYEDGYLDTPARFVQRIAAVRPGANTEVPQLPVRYRLLGLDPG